MEDLQNIDPLYYEHIMIQNELHKLITLINESSVSAKQKEELREKTYAEFLSRAKEYKSCPAFKNMTVEELRNEYESFVKYLKNKNEGR